MKKSVIDWIAIILVVVGGLNWGLVGLFDLDLVATLLGSIAIVQKIVYILVGVAALYVLYTEVKDK